MITVTMYLRAGEFCKGFTIKGHADSYVGDSSMILSVRLYPQSH